MKRIQYHRYGGPQVMALQEVAVPVPGPRQVLVHVRAAASNPLDAKIRNGQMRAMTGRRFPRSIGFDLAGVVQAVGEGVTRFGVGDHVFGATSMRAPGAFAQMALAPEGSLALKPDDLPFERAATLPVVGLTALQALTRAGRLQRGQSVFIHACVGAVGSVAVHIATHLGAQVTGSCRPSSTHLASRAGVQDVVDFDVDLHSGVRWGIGSGADSVASRLAGRFDLVFDTVGALPGATSRALIKPGGRIVDIVPTAGKVVRALLPGPHTAHMGRPRREDLEALAHAAAREGLRVPVATTVGLGDAVAALTDLEAGRLCSSGKVVVVMD